MFAKLDRADEHLAELNMLLHEHLSRPDLIVGTITWNPTTRRIGGRYTRQGLPHRLPVVAGDALHNLRSSLDHMTWQLVIASGGTPDRGTQFPILTEPKAVKISGGVAPSTLRVIEAAQPYSEPEWARLTHPLAVLNYASNVDKHRTPIRGNHGMRHLVMTSGPEDNGREYGGRIIMGEVTERGTQVLLDPLPGSEGQVGGDAWYEVDIEYADQPEAFVSLMSTLERIAAHTRRLVGRPHRLGLADAAPLSGAGRRAHAARDPTVTPGSRSRLPAARAGGPRREANSDGRQAPAQPAPLDL